MTIFNPLTIFKPFIRVMDTYWHVTKLEHKYKLDSFFDVKSIVKINCCNASFTSSVSAKV